MLPQAWSQPGKLQPAQNGHASQVRLLLLTLQANLSRELFEVSLSCPPLPCRQPNKC